MKTKEVVFIRKDEVIKDLLGIGVSNPNDLSDHELEDVYNEKFYIGWKGQEYKINHY